jgi:hypothetical protein
VPRPLVASLLLVAAATVAIAATAPEPAGAEPPAVTASFTWSPTEPLTDQTVTFTSTTTVAGSDMITAQEWDLDGNGVFGDAVGPTASWSFDVPGVRYVTLRAYDSKGTPSDAVNAVTVRNRNPSASVAQSPSNPLVGEVVTYFSTSTDRDGFIKSYAWDLNNDGRFNDGSQALARRSYARAGKFAVWLRVTDDRGASSEVKHVVTVRDPFPGALPVIIVPGPPAPVAVSGLPLLNPFPVVRISGLVRRRGVRLRLVEVKAPVGARVKVSCAGRRGCPFRRRVKQVRGSGGASGSVPASRLVRVRSFNGGFVRAGALVQVFVTKPGTIGKYTRLKIRRGRLPVRADRCVEPGAALPVRCPAG